MQKNRLGRFWREIKRRNVHRSLAVYGGTAYFVSLVTIVGLILYNLVSCDRVRTDLYTMEKSIAVLPFDNLSPDTAQRWFAESISDVISSQLSKISGYRVIGRKSTERFRNKEKNIAEIGEVLGVNFVVDGAVQKQGDLIRIITQLILVRNETYLWSEEYTGDWNEIFVIQSDIAKKVAGSLQTALSPEEDEKIAYPGTENPEAWEYYVQGEVLMENLTEANIWKAIDKYKQAIDLDDKFAQAYAGLASAYFELTIWDVPDPDPAYIPVAQKWAFKALELNENLAQPHFVLGAISYHHDWDWKAAEKEFKTGMELDSSYLWGLAYYANFLTFMGRFNESISISEYLLKLDPLNPSGYLELSFSYMNLGQDEKAEELIKRSMELNPNSYNGNLGLAFTYALKGINLQFVYDCCDEQLGEFNHDLRKIPSFTLKDIGILLALAGGQEQVSDILNELTYRIDSGTKDTPYCALGIIYNALGESEKAIDYLEKGVEIGEPFIFSINCQPSLRTLRSDKRFQDLITRLGFEI